MKLSPMPDMLASKYSQAVYVSYQYVSLKNCFKNNVQIWLIIVDDMTFVILFSRKAMILLLFILHSYLSNVT